MAGASPSFLYICGHVRSEYLRVYPYVYSICTYLFVYLYFCINVHCVYTLGLAFRAGASLFLSVFEHTCAICICVYGYVCCICVYLFLCPYLYVHDNSVHVYTNINQQSKILKIYNGIQFPSRCLSSVCMHANIYVYI